MIASMTALSACGDDDATLTIVTYDSFVAEDGVFDEFTRRTGRRVEILAGGDAGTVVARAVLSAGNPEGDVLWGLDNTLLSRARDADLLESYEPVDTGDVCVNVHDAWFAERGIEPPTTLDDLADPRWRGMLVVQDPAASSPGLAFLLATIERFGEEGWLDYWRRLADNDVSVVSGWTTAYNEEFSASGGDRPLVVSYGSSPPAEVVYADPPVDEPPTSVMVDSCFRQIEYAGVLRGTDDPDGAAALVEYLLGRTFQESLPLSMFVWPVNPDAEIPEVFRRFAVRPEEPTTMEPDRIAAGRQRWLEEWSALGL
jgi:thiamine transport system substrate-binding protein